MKTIEQFKAKWDWRRMDQQTDWDELSDDIKSYGQSRFDEGLKIQADLRGKGLEVHKVVTLGSAEALKELNELRGEPLVLKSNVKLPVRQK